MANRVRVILRGTKVNFHLNLKIVYVVWTLSLCTLFLLRTLWAWPDVTWQSQFWFIEDVNTLLSGRMADTTWFDWGGRADHQRIPVVNLFKCNLLWLELPN